MLQRDEVEIYVAYFILFLFFWASCSQPNDVVCNQIVDLEAERSKLRLELKHARGETDPKHVGRMQALDKENKDWLKRRILELENEIGILHIFTIIFSLISKLCVLYTIEFLKRLWNVRHLNVIHHFANFLTLEVTSNSGGQLSFEHLLQTSPSWSKLFIFRQISFEQKLETLV